MSHMGIHFEESEYFDQCFLSSLATALPDENNNTDEKYPNGHWNSKPVPTEITRIDTNNVLVSLSRKNCLK